MIPQSSPLLNYLAHKEAIDEAVLRVLKSGWYILGDEVAQFEKEFALAMSAQWAVGVANGTDAIELALRASGVEAGDFVATVSHTAVATVAAIARIGAFPLFIDIDPFTYTMSAESLRSVLSLPVNKLKAIIIVHLYGHPADMGVLVPLARSRNLVIIEDCAQAHGAAISGNLVGSWGDLSCFSFYPTKNLGALGDGGAIVGEDPSLQNRLKQLREYGWKTRYVSEEFGINSRLDEVQAAILRVKLRHLHTENLRRQEIAALYNNVLINTSLVLPTVKADHSHVFHQYVVQVQSRTFLRESLNKEKIATLVHYPFAVHQQPAFSDRRYQPVALTNTESILERILSLPMFPELSDQQVADIGACIASFGISLEYRR